jgi:hypothetical protein
MKNSKLLILVSFLVGLTCSLKAQISLAPSFVFLDKNSGVGNLFVSNNSQKAYEVMISFAFGYPGSDANGNLIMNYHDSIAYNTYALDKMIRAFPRSFILKGGEQRTVRIQVVPGQHRNDGFYFTRLKVMAKPQMEDVSSSTTQEIGTKINFNFEQITAVFYRKGKVNTGVNVKKMDIQQNKNMLEVRPELERTGNAPFLGSMFAKLKDIHGKVVAEAQSTTTVYFDEIRRIDLKLDKLNPGTYKFELSFETQRNDMMSEDLVQAPRIVKEAMVDIK